jgi:probable lipoprotein NlpC
MLRAEIQSWLGTPHRMGGMSRRGIDCSGLVVVLYDDLFDLRLPRTTTALMRRGRRVEKRS